MSKKQIVIWNLVAFGVAYYILLKAISINIQNPSHIVSPVVIQYLISWWIVKPQIDKKDKAYLIKYTWIVSLAVYLVRLLLGFILNIIFA